MWTRLPITAFPRRVRKRYRCGGLSRTIKTFKCWILHIGLKSSSAVKEPPVFGAMTGNAKGEALVVNRCRQFANNIAFGSHLDGCPIGEGAVVHSKPIVMFGYGHDKTRS